MLAPQASGFRWLRDSLITLIGVASKAMSLHGTYFSFANMSFSVKCKRRILIRVGSDRAVHSL